MKRKYSPNKIWETKRIELYKKCMLFAKDNNLQFFKNWHIGLCIGITNYARDSRCVVEIRGENGRCYKAVYNSYYEFEDKTHYKGSPYVKFPCLTLFSYNNYFTEEVEKTTIVEDLFFIEINDILQDIPYAPYTNIQTFDHLYLNRLNSTSKTIFALKSPHNDEISFVLYMPSFENDIKLVKEIYPAVNRRGEIYFSKLESKLLLSCLEMHKLLISSSTDKLNIVNQFFYNLHNFNDKDSAISVLREYDNLLPRLNSPNIFDPMQFTEELDRKKEEIMIYVKALDIHDIANQYILRLEKRYWRVGGNRDGYDAPYLSICVSEDRRRDDFISLFLPSHVSTDEYLDNNAYSYNECGGNNEIDSYILKIRQNIVQSFIERYSEDQHISYILHKYVYNEFDRKYTILAHSLENSLKISHLYTWIMKYFMS